LSEARRSTGGSLRRARGRAAGQAWLLVVLALVLAGCTGGEEDVAFAGRDQTSALLVRWVNNGNGDLIGSIQMAEKAASAEGPPVKQSTFTFTGKLDSDQVSLVVKGDSSATQTWNGSLDGDELRVEVPQGTRAASSVRLPKGSGENFNTFVRELETETVKARADASRASAESERQARNSAAATANREAFDAAVSGVSAAQETLAAFLLDPPELKDLPEDLDGARDNLAIVKSNVGEAAARARGSAACDFATRAQSAADDVDDDASFLEDDSRAVTDAATDLANARADLSQAYLTLQKVSEREGHSSKSGSPALQAMIDKVRSTTSAWRKAADTADKTMKSLVSEANSLARNARLASC
jgi:hypothetical protein